MALTGFDCGFDSGFIDPADCATIVTPDSCWAQCCPTCCGMRNQAIRQNPRMAKRAMMQLIRKRIKIVR